jgi:thioredoxin reductase (NADPH)
MSENTEQQIDEMFPALTDAQIARLSAFGEQKRVDAGEIVFDQGDASRGVFVVLEGSIEVTNVTKDHEDVLRVLRRGEFTGEVNQLSGGAVWCDAGRERPAVCSKLPARICGA